MNKIITFLITITSIVSAFAANAAVQSFDVAIFVRSQESLGTVNVRAVPQGVLLFANFKNLSPGAHAFHIHEFGICEGDFKSTGAHFNPSGEKHGLFVEGHAGDMPNIHIGDNGRLKVEILNTKINLINEDPDSILNRAFIIHEGPDDYKTQPSGAAGPRIGCGVIKPK